MIKYNSLSLPTPPAELQEIPVAPESSIAECVITPEDFYRDRLGALRPIIGKIIDAVFG